MKYILELEFTSENEYTSKELTELFQEQWEQTAASMEGDTIRIISIKDSDAQSN